MRQFGKEFSNIAEKYNLKMETCAEEIDLSEYGIDHGSCIDKKMIEQVANCELKKLNKPKERPDCGCYQAIDIGQYDTCMNNCIYCYATRNYNLATSRFKNHNSKSPILFGDYDKNNIKDRVVKSFRENQIKFDL
ncbi:hypothetical protein SDC9_91163 [bioreactor metagenome]|uniref:Uncharacterized protein n=1 Tax=bioreactor metagenome TaxID=1076179 RepID=A0A644ZUD7_9ZZZZ